MARRKKRSRAVLLAAVILLASAAVPAALVIQEEEPAVVAGSLDDGLWSAIASVESGGNPLAFNPADGAAGIVQIRQTCVDDCNRIARRRGLPVQFASADRFNPEKSRQMWDLYLAYYGEHYERTTGLPPTNEVYARLWNGGPTGWKKDATAPYWARVREAMPEPLDAEAPATDRPGD
jgi:hypothetical protein